jgi:hypothetical protein
MPAGGHENRLLLDRLLLDEHARALSCDHRALNGRGDTPRVEAAVEKYFSTDP